jgi:predicted nucleotidyltransferase
MPDVSQKSVEDIRRRARPVLEEYGVEKAEIFGSYARQDQERESDVDFLVSFGEQKTLVDVVSLKKDLERVLGLEVDIVTYQSLNPRIEKRAKSDTVPVI